MLANGLRVVIVAVVFLWLQPLLGLLVLTPMPAVGVFRVRFNRRVKPVYQASRAAVGALTAKIAENVGGIRVIQAFAQEERELAATRRLGELLSLVWRAHDPTGRGRQRRVVPATASHPESRPG